MGRPKQRIPKLLVREKSRNGVQMVNVPKAPEETMAPKCGSSASVKRAREKNKSLKRKPDLGRYAGRPCLDLLEDVFSVEFTGRSSTNVGAGSRTMFCYRKPVRLEVSRRTKTFRLHLTLEK